MVVSSWFFSCAQSGKAQHQHHLINVINHGPQSCIDWFEPIQSLRLTDISAHSIQSKVAAVRDLDLDLAIDLSGWTSGHFLAGFLARLAPVQCSYLGFFASTGIQEIDYWLGDWSLFPFDYAGWHTENLWRLDRPFLAWQPVDPLPEATAAVTSAPSGPIRFGSFNHNRKLSDQTLRLWGQILESVPESTGLEGQCVVRSGDPAVVTASHASRCTQTSHLDPLTAGHTEHLQQYQHGDIASDPLPNGGCTTT